MANWREFKIIGKDTETSGSGYIRFRLDGQVNYDKVSEARIYCKKTLPFTEWEENDKVNIDIEKVCQYDISYEFTLYDNAIFKSSSHWKNKYWEAVREKNNLETERDEWRRKYYDKNSDYEEEKKGRKKHVDSYNELLRKNEVLTERCKNLTDRLEEYEEYKEMYENTRNERESERVNNTREITTLRRDNVALQGQLTRTQQRLTASENKVLRIEDRLEAKGREVLELRGKLERLNINVNNLEKSREELLNEKVSLKNEKLEVFANNLGINLDEVDNLLRYYGRLIHARKNYNQANIETHEGNVSQVKGTLRQNGVSVENTNKCCRKCEKVAKLRMELNEIRQQQFEARQEVLPRQ